MNWILILLIVILCIAIGDNASAADTVTVPAVTLQDSLVAIIQQVTAGVSAGVSFLQAEIPDVIRQLLLWKMVQAIVICGFCLLYLIAYYLGSIKAIEYDKNHRYEDLSTPVVIIGGFIAIGVLGSLIYGVQIALQIWIAPKVWLIEYAASLVK